MYTLKITEYCGDKKVVSNINLGDSYTVKYNFEDDLIRFENLICCHPIFDFEGVKLIAVVGKYHFIMENALAQVFNNDGSLFETVYTPIEGHRQPTIIKK